MVQIPKSLNHSNITDKEIRAYYSLTPCEEDHEIHAKRFDKIIKEYMTNTQKFKSKNAEYSFKKRIKNWAKDRPDNSKVWDAFMSWRIGQINRHIAKQRDGGFTKQSVTEKEQRDLICQLRREILQKDMIIKGLTEENNQLKSNNKIEMIIEEVVKEEVKEEIVIEEVNEDPYALLEADSDFEDDPHDTESEEEDLVEEVSSDEEEEEVKEEVIVKKEEEIITGLYETCENLKEATELYYETCDKQADKMEKLLNKSGDNKQDLKNDYFDWLQNERDSLDELHAIDIDDPLWDKLVDKPYEIFGDNLNHLISKREALAI
tara:strand:- start:3342 stop:4298 length:957 start_codon:yes stop_codon:yes gene_type:complete